MMLVSHWLFAERRTYNTQARKKQACSAFATGPDSLIGNGVAPGKPSARTRLLALVSITPLAARSITNPDFNTVD